jgi:L-asparaginase II
MSSVPAITPPRQLAASGQAPLSAVIRGTALESLHVGSIAVTDRDGRLLYSAGDPQTLTFTRSSLKPLQALPFVAAGGAERFGFTQAEVALMCASHSGEPRHVDAAHAMLAKAGNHPDDLQCGTHPPRYFEVRGEIPPQPPWSPLAHNCSGKHSGMLAYCVACDLDKRTYLDFDHPLQQAIRRSVAEFTAVPEADLVAGVDGCSAPNYAVPLARLAGAFARLASSTVDAVYGDAPRTLADAMMAHPEMVSGAGRSDLALMRAGGGDWVTKVGAEGVQAIGIRSRGWGIAIKVADGGFRGLHPATVATLDQLGLLDDASRDALRPLGRPTLKNLRGLVIGEVCPVVVLDKITAPPDTSSNRSKA